MRTAAAAAGMDVEERAEGWLLVDPDAVATDQRFPDDSSHSRVAALILLDHLVAAQCPVAVEVLDGQAAAVLARFPGWAKTYRSDGGAVRLASDATGVLCAFGLAVREPGGVRALPAAARFAISAPQEAP